MDTIYLFDVYLYAYDDNGLINRIQEKRKLSVKAKTRAKAYDKAKTKYPFHFVELRTITYKIKN